MAQVEFPKNITVQKNMMSSKNILDMESTVTVIQLPCSFSFSIKEALHAHELHIQLRKDILFYPKIGNVRSYSLLFTP